MTAPPPTDSSGACESGTTTSPSTTGARATDRFVEMRRAQPTFAANGTRAAVRIIDRREKSAISVVRGTAPDPLFDRRQRVGARRAGGGRGLPAPELRVEGGAEPELGQEEGRHRIARVDQNEASGRAQPVGGRRVHQRC